MPTRTFAFVISADSRRAPSAGELNAWLILCGLPFPQRNKRSPQLSTQLSFSQLDKVAQRCRVMFSLNFGFFVLTMMKQSVPLVKDESGVPIRGINVDNLLGYRVWRLGITLI